jgi:hypothetical protein
MSVLELHQMTQQVCSRLPSDLVHHLTDFVGMTRLDWRTCKRHEANIIVDYNAWMILLVEEVLARRRNREEVPPLRVPSLWFYRVWVWGTVFLNVGCSIWVWLTN